MCNIIHYGMYLQYTVFKILICLSIGFFLCMTHIIILFNIFVPDDNVRLYGENTHQMHYLKKKQVVIVSVARRLRHLRDGSTRDSNYTSPYHIMIILNCHVHMNGICSNI